MIDMFTII